MGLGTAADGQNGLWSTDPTGAIALIIGSEGDGMSRLVKESCDFILNLPMKGQVSSLNASAAAAVTMYEVLRQRSARGGLTPFPASAVKLSPRHTYRKARIKV